jgi:hypothetical protein
MWLLLSPAVSAAGANVNEASREQLKAAQKTFEVANDLYDAKRYEEAITAFRASYEIVASPNSRLMVARALRELGRFDDAYKDFLAALSDAEAAAQRDKKYRKTVDAAREELKALEQRVGLLSVELVSAPEGSQVEVAGKHYTPAELATPIAVAPGKVTIVARAPQRPAIERSLELAAGSRQALRIDLAAPAETGIEGQPVGVPAPAESSVTLEPPRSGGALRTLAFVAGGVGVAGLATFGIFGTLNNQKFSELEDECAEGRCPAERQEDIDAGRQYQTIANIGLIVGVVGVGAGTVLFLMSGRSAERAALPMDVALGPSDVQVRGRF